ncbi:MAG: hypothetical protein ABI442_07630 [Gemmatimonadaceae bacterium]
MHSVVHQPSRVFTALSAAIVVAVAGCSRNSGAARADTASASGTVAAAPDSATMVRGTITSATPTELNVRGDGGTVDVKLAAPVQVYDREPARLADISDNTFVGVTSVKQPDGSERATEIHIFPEELRGLGEGSRMMSADTSSSRMTNGASRMTNGSSSRMTNGTASGSGMTKGPGTANAGNGSTLVVQFAGGSQSVVVPPNVTVTQLRRTNVPLVSGSQVVVLAKKGADGLLSANRVIIAGK